MTPDDTTPEEFMDDAGLAPKSPGQPVMKTGKTKVVRKKLLKGEVEGAELKPEKVTQETTRLMKVVSITRSPKDRIAEIELRVKDGTLYNLEIDEGTAKAIAAVFDD